MQTTLLVARLLLSGVFGVAGLAKLADLAGSRQALKSFGVPGRLAIPLGILLPLAELAVAAALLPADSAWYGSLGALSLLLLFVIGISINLARGLTPDCHCFGQLSSSPAGWPTLIRNAALAAIAGFVVWGGVDNPGPSAVSWFADLTVAQRLLSMMGLAGLVLLALEGWVLLQMLRQQGRLLVRLDAIEARIASGGLAPASTEVPSQPAVGLPVGSSAPAFRLAGLRGETLTLDALLEAGNPVMLLFTNPSCGPCQALMPDINLWQRNHMSALTIALISEGTARDNRAKSSQHGVTHVLLQRKREVAEAYQAHGTPGAVLIQADGTIGSSVAMGAEAIRALVAQTLGMATPAPMLAAPSAPQNGNGSKGEKVVDASPVKVGQPAPPLKLQDLKGKTVTLNNFRGSNILMLFWNPGCGFCEQMLDDLKAWEADPPLGAPKLLVISSGTVEENLNMNLRSPVVLDPNFQVGAAFEANGTPMAVLIDAKGRVASEVVGGAQAVLALAGSQPNESASAS